MENTNSTYNPKPADTSDVVLPQEIMELRELLAENTHNVWAVGRIREGWRYGSVKDMGKKLHPDLVPYDELPDSEKEYDRNTSEETLKLIYKLGFEIVKR